MAVRHPSVEDGEQHGQVWQFGGPHGERVVGEDRQVGAVAEGDPARQVLLARRVAAPKAFGSGPQPVSQAPGARPRTPAGALALAAGVTAAAVCVDTLCTGPVAAALMRRMRLIGPVE
ncbi:hypothetical protein SAVIM40S_03570 [Streptomyces avidinii]